MDMSTSPARSGSVVQLLGDGIRGRSEHVHSGKGQIEIAAKRFQLFVKPYFHE